MRTIIKQIIITALSIGALLLFCNGCHPVVPWIIGMATMVALGMR